MGDASLATRYAYKPGQAALSLYVAAALLVAAVINVAILSSIVGAGTQSLKNPAFALPGLERGRVWEVLFVCLAAAYGFSRRPPPLPDRRAAVTALLGMILVVLAFPLYALLPKSLLNSFVGTAASAFIAWIVCGVVYVNSKHAALLLLPLALWLSYASVVAFHVHRLNLPINIVG
jgi:tryptophan-rich sensory protein